MRKRDRRYRRGLILVLLAMASLIILQTWWLWAIARSSDKANKQLSCALAVESHVTTKALERFARHFGADLPRGPGIPKECGGKDPVFVGSQDDDVMDGTASPDWMNGEGGDDLVRGHGGGDTLIGGSGRDTVWGGAGTDWEYGGGRSDELHAAGDEAVDHLDGGDGNDWCYVRPNDLAKNCENIVHIPS